MRIAAVGALVADTIVHADGSETESLGGIAHTTAALAAIAGGEHDIVPIFRVGDDQSARVDQWAAKLDGVSLDGVIPMREPTPTVRLTYDRAGERVEQLRHMPPPLEAAEVAAAAGADAVIVNCITGEDLSLEALREVRAGTGRLYFDIHSLALGFEDDGRRFHRGRGDWNDWLDSADVVQCNEAEARTLCAAEDHGVEEPSGAPELVDLLGARIRVLPRVPAAWLLTRGERGAVVFTGGDKARRPAEVPAPACRVVDPTGAGDTFGAAYTCAWLAGEPPVRAAERAVRYASAACAIAGMVDPQGLRAAIDKLPG